jgi:hypothetical protein
MKEAMLRQARFLAANLSEVGIISKRQEVYRAVLERWMCQRDDRKDTEEKMEL